MLLYNKIHYCLEKHHFLYECKEIPFPLFSQKGLTFFLISHYFFNGFSFGLNHYLYVFTNSLKRVVHKKISLFPDVNESLQWNRVKNIIKIYFEILFFFEGKDCNNFCFGWETPNHSTNQKLNSGLKINSNT